MENKMRLFKRQVENLENGGYKDVIVEISDSEISSITNSYGRWIESSHWVLDNSDFEENENGLFNMIDYSYNQLDTDIKTFDSIKDWDFENLTENQRDVLIELSKYSIDNSDEADSSYVYEISITENNELFELSIEEDKPIGVGTQYKYWDGHNWKAETLSHDFYECEIEEVTNEYENWEAKQFLYTTDEKYGRNTRFYVLETENGNVLLREDCTRWQGEMDTFEVISDEDEILELLQDNVEKETINEFFSNIVIE
jgi:hypothetical protein